MLTLKSLARQLVLLSVAITPALAITVTTPSDGARLTSPFKVSGSSSTCGSQPVASMGYSLDYGATTIVPTPFTASVTASVGTHTLHIKCWGTKGAAQVTDLSITVIPTVVLPVKTSPVIPATAIVVKDVQTKTNWVAAYDLGTSGTSTGATTLTASPSMSGSSRQFITTYADYGGERYSDSFGSDVVATHFVYDTWLYLAEPASSIANVELDMNQVTANGETVIYGFQCDGWSHTWDYTTNSGTPQQPSIHWLHSSKTCDPRTWTTNAWHHIQISFARDEAGNVTYQSVWFDSIEQAINVTTPSSFALGWGKVLLINFQIDGMTSTQSSSTVYLDNLTIYRW